MKQKLFTFMVGATLSCTQTYASPSGESSEESSAGARPKVAVKLLPLATIQHAVEEVQKNLTIQYTVEKVQNNLNFEAYQAAMAAHMGLKITFGLKCERNDPTEYEKREHNDRLQEANIHVERALSKLSESGKKLEALQKALKVPCPVEIERLGALQEALGKVVPNSVKLKPGLAAKALEIFNTGFQPFSCWPAEDDEAPSPDRLGFQGFLTTFPAFLSDHQNQYGLEELLNLDSWETVWAEKIPEVGTYGPVELVYDVYLRFLRGKKE